jgi:hypothetical protein
MKAHPWIVAGGLTAYFVLNQPGPQFATGNDNIEDAAGKTAFGEQSSEHRGRAEA